jgi:hypothetical protein
MQTTLREKRRGGGAVAGMLAIVLVFVAVLAIAFAVRGTDFFLYKLFAPREEAARRETFEQSKSYRDGLAQELWDMRDRSTEVGLPIRRLPMVEVHQPPKEHHARRT